MDMKVLVVVAGGLHLGYLGCYGNLWIETPCLDRLAAEGIVFDQHYADCPASNFRTSWTGRYCFPGLDGGDDSHDPPPQLGQLLEAHGIPRTLIPDPGRFSEMARPAGIDLLEVARGTVARALDRLGSPKQWLVWLDLPSLAPPWEVPGEYLERYFAKPVPDEELDPEQAEETPPLEPWLDPACGPLDVNDETAWQRLQNTYAAVVSHLDAQLGLLLDELDRRGLTNEVLLCVTAERGLALGEHGILGDHRPWLHEEFIHLPLLIRLPGRVEAGRRVGALTQPLDLLPTLLDAFGLPLPATHGHSLLPLLHGKAEQVRPYACAGAQVGEAVEWALRTPEWAFLLPVRPAPGDPPRSAQLYVKPDDRWEMNSLVQHHLEWSEELEKTLRGFVVATRQPGPFQLPPLPEE